jgi:hypothetical protein
MRAAEIDFEPVLMDAVVATADSLFEATPRSRWLMLLGAARYAFQRVQVLLIRMGSAWRYFWVVWICA